jgi:hypothetical protein
MLTGKPKNPDLGSRKGRRVTTGTDSFRRDQRWHRVDRTIDHGNDWYDDTITDEATAQAGVIR